ncbi:hypothetical protein AAFN85_26230 [Mucilaginibacter sp. CAU 1740]|uniref:hypothetical protein n=1 Tax=Mucilaginibacter sp. CAU 1740 TaxID=3140365 RepID=UPI00325C1C07
MQSETAASSSWLGKFFEVVLVFVAGACGIYMLLTSFAPQTFYMYFGRMLDTWLIEGLSAAVLLALGYSIYWHLKERKTQFGSTIKYAWFRAIIRYFVAYTISVYGFAKICQTQFAHYYFRDDIPAGHLNGLSLTWYYFGHSYTFAVILGCIQISGGILLMFRRTTLLGTYILLPVMFNIVLINLFYDIAFGALVVAIILTVSLVYLLLLRWHDLKVLFLSKPIIPPIKLSFLKPIVIPLLLVTAFYSVYHYVANKPSPAPFTGIWKVTELKRNGKPDNENAWVEHASSFHKIYIEKDGTIAFSANPYVFDDMKAWFGSYQYDDRRKVLNVFFNGPTGDTTKVIVKDDYIDKSMRWNTVINKDTLQIKLYKQ